jgi:hypothetical protein
MMKLQCTSMDFASQSLVCALYNTPTQQFVRSNLPVTSNESKRLYQRSTAENRVWKYNRRVAKYVTLSLKTVSQDLDDMT